MAKETKLEKISEKIIAELLERMGVTAKITCQLTDEKTVNIGIDGDDLGVLIGFHGDNLKALQIIAGILINREVKSEDWVRVSVDVGSWRASRQASLEEMAQRAVAKVKETGKPFALPPMSPDERRLIHVFLQEEKEIETTSAGEGSERHIVIAKQP